MELTLASYELSKILKQYGYNGKCFCYYRLSLIEEAEPFIATEIAYFRQRYDNHNHRIHSQPHQIEAICTAPSLEEVKQWFRVEHNLQIEPSFYDDPDTYEFDIWTKDTKWDLGSKCKNYETYDQALEAGIYKALEHIEPSKHIGGVLDKN